ncbi:MAG: imelysin family protein, partial [Hyphomicrobiales bacterium]
MPGFIKRAEYWIVSAVLTVGLSFPASANDTTADHVDISSVIETAIVPAFHGFESSASEMQDAMSALCAQPSPSALQSSRASFNTLVGSWGQVEFIRLGPLAAENRLERILFWPDRRGRGLKQVQNIIRTSDATATSVQMLGKKSVAVQGLLALEFALFGTGADSLSSSDNSFRCGYALAISENLKQLSSELVGLWSDQNRIRQLWLKPGPDNPLFRNNQEQLAALIKMIRDGLEIMVAQRLTPFLREDQASAKPMSALFWRSENTIRSLQANMIGLQNLVEASRFDRTLDNNNKRVVKSLGFESKNALRALAASDLPTQKIVEDADVFGRLIYVRIVVLGMFDILENRLPAMFG